MSWFARFGSCAVLVAGAIGAASLQAAPSLPPVNAVPSQLAAPGNFIWFDLVTDDVAASRSFYGALFGWTFRSTGSSASDYTVVSLGQRDIGGMLRPEAAVAPRARWISLMSVTDPSAAARLTVARGGKVLVAPAAVPHRGTHALLADAEGAVFGVLRSSTGDPVDTPVPDGDFFWVDLFSRDPARAAAFYRELAGYEVYPSELEAPGGARLVLAAGGLARAGVAPLPRTDLRPGWLPYVLVADVAAATQRAVAAGGRVLLAPRPDVLDSQLAVVADPRGGVIGLVNWRAGEPAAGAPK